MDCGGVGTALIVMAHMPQAAAAYFAVQRRFHAIAALVIATGLATIVYHTYDCQDYAKTDKKTRAAWHTAQVEAFVLAAANFAAIATSVAVKHNVVVTTYATTAALVASVYAFSWGRDTHYGALAVLPVLVGAGFWAARYAAWRRRTAVTDTPPITLRRHHATNVRAAAIALLGIVAGIAAEAVLASDGGHAYFIWHSAWHLGTGTAMAAAMKMWPQQPTQTV